VHFVRRDDTSDDMVERLPLKDQFMKKFICHEGNMIQ